MGGSIAGVRYGIVVGINDETGSDSIAVRLIPEDNSKEYNEVIEAKSFPLMPKNFHIKPKVGEGVFILLSVLNDGNSQRYYIGPVVSQLHRLYYDPAREGGDSFMRGARKGLDSDHGKIAHGVFPDDEDIAILGRKNTDIILKDDDLRIRAGVKKTDTSEYGVTFNEKDPAYIKLKYHEKPLDGDNHSTATIVADKINLFSNKSTKTPNGVKFTNVEDLMTDEDINKTLEETYKLPYGEKLVKLLKTMISIFCAHTHDYIALPPNALFIEEMETAAKEPLDQGKLLSDSIRIN